MKKTGTTFFLIANILPVLLTPKYYIHNSIFFNKLIMVCSENFCWMYFILLVLLKYRSHKLVFYCLDSRRISNLQHKIIESFHLGKKLKIMGSHCQHSPTETPTKPCPQVSHLDMSTCLFSLILWNYRLEVFIWSISWFPSFRRTYCF